MAQILSKTRITCREITCREIHGDKTESSLTSLVARTTSTKITIIAPILILDRTTKISKVFAVEEVGDFRIEGTRMIVGVITLGSSGEMIITCRKIGDLMVAIFKWTVILCMIRTLVEIQGVEEAGVEEEEEGEDGMKDEEEVVVVVEEIAMMGISISQIHSIAKEIGTKDQVIVTLIIVDLGTVDSKEAVVLKGVGQMITAQGGEEGAGGIGEIGGSEGAEEECLNIVMISSFAFHFIITLHVFV